MSIVLEFDSDITRIMANIDEQVQGLEKVGRAYGEVKQKIKDVGVKGEQVHAASKANTKAEGKEVKKQIGIIEKLEGHLERLKKGQRKATDIKDLKKYNTEIAKTEATLNVVRKTGVKSLKGINAGATASSKVFKLLSGTIKSAFLPLLAVGAIAGVVKNMIGLVNEYEQAAADLSAITGATGDKLEFLKQKAVEVGTTTTISATKTLEAYKLIASAKPELLQNAQALAEITKEAVTLTEAIGGDLPDVATNLTDIMNKFGAPASEAARYINALAAGSKEGSAEVNDIAAAMLAAGTEMKGANISLEEGVGLVEALAEKGKKGAEAGTGLRNVISKLSATDILPKQARERLLAAGVNMQALSDKSKTFRERLLALKPIQNDANALTAVFGLENKTTAKILLEQIDRVGELTKAVTGTNIANEQAAIRTATVKGEMMKLKNTVAAMVQSGFKGVSKYLALIIRFVRNGLLFWRDRMNDLKDTVRPLNAAVSRLLSSIAALLPKVNSNSKAMITWGKAVKILNVPMKIFLIIFTKLLNIAADYYTWLGKFKSKSNILSKFFKIAADGAGKFIDVFVNLPAYVSGGLAAVEVFVKETAKRISKLGDNIGSVFKEAFSFGNLIKNGRGDLKAATKNLLGTFDGVGTKAAEAFRAEFKKANEKAVIVPISTAAQSSSTGSTPTADNSGQSGSGGIETDAKERAKQAQKEAEEIARLNIQALAEGKDKELAIEEAAYQDLLSKLNKYQIDTEAATFEHEKKIFDIKTKYLEAAANTKGLTGEEKIKFLYENTKKEIEAIAQAVQDSGGQLTAAQQNQINILQAEAAKQYLTQLKTLQNKELTESEKHEILLIENKRGTFEDSKKFEEYKGKEILKIRLKYAEAHLALLRAEKGEEDNAVLALKEIIGNIKSDIDSLPKTDEDNGFSIYKLLGVDPNDPENKRIIEGIDVAARKGIEILQQVTAERLKAANMEIQASKDKIKTIDDEIAAKQNELDENLSLAEKGYANNVERVRGEIALLREQKAAEKEEQRKAVADKIKLQRRQATIDTITQASSLITASAQVFQSVAAIPFVGPIIGAGLVAAMIGSFISAKAKVYQSINKQKARHGASGVVRGKYHEQGGEEFPYEVERGEAYGILSREATNMYGDLFREFTAAANRGDRATMASIAEQLTGAGSNKRVAGDIEDKAAKLVSITTGQEMEFKAQQKELQKETIRTNKLLEILINQNKEGTITAGSTIITKRGNTTKIMRKNA